MVQQEHTELIHTYLRAKDESRPILFRQVFLKEGRFQTRFSIDTDFNQGGMRHGLDTITQTFQQLGAGFENIFTTCPIESAFYNDVGQLESSWVVGMTGRNEGQVRLAAGSYLWTFDSDSGLVKELDVLMEHMLVLPAHHAESILSWLSPLPQPWCRSVELLERMPHLSELQPVRDYFSNSFPS